MEAGETMASETIEKPTSEMPTEFDWTTHFRLRDNRNKALCGKKLLGIPMDGRVTCEECKRLKEERESM